MVSLMKWLAALVCLVPLLLYIPILRADYVAYDDELLIVDNGKARGLSWGNVKAAFTTYDPELYIPLTLLTEQIEYSIVGKWNPAVSHGISLVLHALNAVLVFWLMTLLLGRFQRTNSRKYSDSSPQVPVPRSQSPIPLLVALLWAVHPLNVEAVAWASARKDLLSGFFFLLSVCGYLKWREGVTLSSSKGDTRRVPWFDELTMTRCWYWGSVLLHLLGLLAKVSIAPLPLVLLLLEWFLPRHPLPAIRPRAHGREAGESRVRGFRSLLPFFALSILFVGIALIGKESQVRSIGVTLLAPFVAIPFYLRKLVIPTGLSILYPFTDELTIMHPAVLAGLFIASVLTLFAVWSLRWTRGIAGALGIFFLLLAPSFLNVARRGDGGIVDIIVASDRYMYLPSLALIALASCWFTPHPGPLPRGEGGNNSLFHWKRAVPCSHLCTTAVRVRGLFLVFGFVGILGCFGFLTHRQLRVWHDSEALFRNVLAQHQASHVAANNLAGFLVKRGETAEAMALYRQSLAIRENPRALFNLGRLFIFEKNYDEALPLFERYVAMKPRDAFGRMQLGGLHLMEGRAAEARPHLAQAVALDPNLTEAHYLLGVALERLGDVKGAQREFRETLRLNPNHPHARAKFQQ